MPRLPRISAPHNLVHVIVRFTAGEPILDSDRARAEYLRRLADAVAPTDWRLVSYALMGTHVHLVFVAGEAPLGSWARSLHTGFGLWINRTDQRRGRGLGPVLAERPTSHPRPFRSAPYLIAYVHNNPDAAGIVDVERVPRTSHHAYLDVAARPVFLDVLLGLRLCGYDDDRDGRDAFHAMVQSRRRDGLDPELEGERGRGAPRPRALEVPPDALLAAPSADELVRRAARLVGARPEELTGGPDSDAKAQARRIACRAGRALGLPSSDLARALRCSRRTVRRAAGADDAATLDVVEAMLAELASGRAA